MKSELIASMLLGIFTSGFALESFSDAGTSAALPIQQAIAPPCIYFPKNDEVLEQYLSEMPWHLYRQYHVKNLGSFWIDDANDCIKQWIKQGRLWEPYIGLFLKKYIKSGDSVIDIGAHIGTLTFLMADLVGEAGKVYAFEGANQLFRELVENVRLNAKRNIIPYFYWIENRNASKWISGSDNYWSTAEYSPVVDGQPFRVEVRTLDSFQFEDISLIKIDVECAEDAVLDGAHETLLRCQPILVLEIMGGHGNSNDPNVQARIRHTISKLEQLGYKVKKIWTDDYLAVPITYRR